MKTIFIKTDGCKILTVSSAATDGFFPVETNEEIETIFKEYAYSNGLVHIGPAPSHFHEVSVTTPSWTIDKNKSLILKSNEIRGKAELALKEPVSGFDADNDSRQRIAGMVSRLNRGDGLTAGWVGWRDAANNMHWADSSAAEVLDGLLNLTRQIEDRDQSVLLQKWEMLQTLSNLQDGNLIADFAVDFV